MHASLIVRPFAGGDSAALLSGMRSQDLAIAAECLGDQPPHQLIELQVLHSREAWVAIKNGEPVCAFGIAVADGGDCIAWFIATARMHGCLHDVLRTLTTMLARVRQTFPVLVTWADASDTFTVRWLQRAGFRLASAWPDAAPGLTMNAYVLGGHAMQVCAVLH